MFIWYRLAQFGKSINSRNQSPFSNQYSNPFQLKKPVSFQFDARVHSVARDFPSFRFASSLQLATGSGTFLTTNLRHVTRLSLKVQTAAVPQTPEDNK